MDDTEGHQWHPITAYYQEGRVPEQYHGYWFCAKCLIVIQNPKTNTEWECIPDDC